MRGVTPARPRSAFLNSVSSTHLRNFLGKSAFYGHGPFRSTFSDPVLRGRRLANPTIALLFEMTATALAASWP
jgi:hypothetical protein